MTTKREIMYKNISKHGENLNRIFDTNFDPIRLSKKLFSIENKLAIYSLRYCNGEIEQEEYEQQEEKTLERLDKILNFKAKKIPVIVNCDPRGYSLKIDDGFIRENIIEIHRDMGGFGILAPDFNN